MNYLKVTHEKLNVQQLHDLALSPNCDFEEVSIFCSKDNRNRQDASHMRYEAYESMALGILEDICKETREKWPEVENIVIYCGLGSVPVRENRIILAISAPIRKDAVDAMEWCFSYVKSRVPIWEAKVDDVDNKPERQRNLESYPPKRKIYPSTRKRAVYVPSTPGPHQIQIKVRREERIENLMKQKRAALDRNNIREFINPNKESECARVDSPFKRRPNSNSHLPVNVVKSVFHRDQFNTDYLLKHIPPNPTEERLQNLESSLGIQPPVTSTFNERLSVIENRVNTLEWMCPAYLPFWQKSGLFTKSKTKKIYSIPEIDVMIKDLEEKLRRKK